MTIAIQVSSISKRYVLGERVSYSALREVMGDAAAAPIRWVKRTPRVTKDSGEIWALRDVSFEVNEGERVGIIGRNGAGKSTLLKVLSRVTEPTRGEALLRGSIGSLLEVGTGFHPELTGRENVYLNGAILGMSRADIDRRFDEIVEFSGVETFLDTPLKRYSSGMQVRLAFAVAAHLDPDILLVDEILAVGDAEFQKKCLARMEEISAIGRTVLFVSHNTASVLRLCPRVILLERGEVVEDGPAHEVIHTYLDTGLGTTAAREWPTAASAPGDDAIRLKAVRVRNESGGVASEFDIRRPIDVEVEYWQLSTADRSQSGVVIGFWNEDGVLLFVSSTYQDREWHARAPQPGLVRATCRIPGNFLAEGQVTVHLEINCFKPPARHVQEQDLVSFFVVDRSSGDAVRGDLPMDWPGVVRPMLDWQMELASDPDRPPIHR